ncbi:hypothetical protein, partial [Streptomyces sp. NPDC002265]|uniref:hypothetical protein n=1 Tax=Streptomyces sp. NPDC002265 TaxID=3154415 RepID=UPI0033341598
RIGPARPDAGPGRAATALQVCARAQQGHHETQFCGDRLLPRRHRDRADHSRLTSTAGLTIAGLGVGRAIAEREGAVIRA